MEMASRTLAEICPQAFYGPGRDMRDALYALNRAITGLDDDDKAKMGRVQVENLTIARDLIAGALQAFDPTFNPD